MAVRIGPGVVPTQKPGTTSPPKKANVVEQLIDNTLSAFEQIDPDAKAALEKLRGALDAAVEAFMAPAPAVTPPAVTPPQSAPVSPPVSAPVNQPVVPSASLPQVQLKQGDTGADVDLLQRDLVKLGYMSDADRQTGPGIFGPHTLAAVEGFQAAWNLPVTGQYDAQTLGALTKALSGTKPPNHGPPGGGNNAAAVAREYLGQNAADLQRSSNLDMDKWPASDVDCANFVSAILEKSGQLPRGQHNDNVNGLVGNLKADGWTSVPLSQARPGDVVTFDGSLGPNQHVELFNAWVNGKPQYIGSNNINPDGSQQVSTDSGSWAYGVHVWHNPNAGSATGTTGTPGPTGTPSPTPPFAAPQVDLQVGNQSAEVDQLQRDLVKLGFMSEADRQTGPGIFGPHTEAALKAFQSAKGVPSTGYYGPLSRAALEKALAGTPAPVSPPPAAPPPAGTGIPTVDLKQGDTGAQVELVQRDLVKLGYLSQAAMNTGPGTFGPHTLSAVEAFQSAWGLPVTGMFGPMSRDAMAKALAGGKPPQGPPTSPGHYPVWLQTDPRWSGMRLIDGGAGENIGPYGCAMTSTAMLLAGSGRTINGQAITSPVVLNRYLQQHQSPGDGDLLEWQTAAQAVGFNAHSVSGGSLDQNLAAGHACVMNIHSGNHWVLVTGKDAQGYICQDPATGTVRHLAGWEMNPWRGWAMY